MHVKAIRTGTDPLMRSRPDHSAPTLASIAKNCRFRQFLSCGGSVRWTVGSPADIRARTLGLVFLELRAARSAGAAPLYAGQPGYRGALDGDSDGVACE